MRLLCLLTFLALLPAYAFAIGNYADEEHEFATEMSRLQTQLDELELSLMMPAYETKLDTGRCKPHIKDAEKHFKAAEALNVKYKDNPTPEYEGQMAEHKELNAFALENYKKCFTNEILYSRKTDTPLFNRMGVSDYESFMEIRERLREKFQWSSGLAAHLAKLKEMMATLQSEGTDTMQRNTKVGIVSDVQGPAWLNHIGGERYSRSVDWKPVNVGDTVFVNDHIKTGDAGLVVINLLGSQTPEASPASVSVGPKSYVVMNKFLSSAKDDQSITSAVMTLLRGASRIFTNKYWAGASVLQVRMGTAICGIRGTDVTLINTPETDSMEYLLDHGVVEIEAPSGTLMLQPKQKVTVQAGKLGVPATLGAGDESRRLITKGSLQINNGGGVLIKQ